MGYHTEFTGSFTINKKLTKEHREYLEKFNRTRRMKRDAEKAALLPDPVREAVGLPIGHEGAYFVGGLGFAGQDHDPSVVDHNVPPGNPPYMGIENFDERQKIRNAAIKDGTGQPGLWCQWVPNPEGTEIVWDQGEKFYEYVEWLEYLIRHFIKPWGYKLNGEVRWHGEEYDDRGTIYVNDNKVEAIEDVIHKGSPSWATA